LPVFLAKDEAINYAQNRASFRLTKIRILGGSNWKVRHELFFRNPNGPTQRGQTLYSLAELPRKVLSCSAPGWTQTRCIESLAGPCKAEDSSRVCRGSGRMCARCARGAAKDHSHQAANHRQTIGHGTRLKTASDHCGTDELQHFREYQSNDRAGYCVEDRREPRLQFPN
jgi:hypothetical protein